MDKARPVVKKEDSDNIVVDHHPKKFPVDVTPEAQEFVSRQEEEGSDFKVSELVAEQVGISEMQKASIEEKIEQQALEKVKDVEEKAYNEAYELGLIEGRKKAFEEQKAEYEQRIHNMDEILKKFETLKQDMEAANEESLIRLMYAVATRIAKLEIQQHPESIVEVIRELVEEVQGEEKIVIRLSGQDLMFLQSFREETGQENDFLNKVKFEPSEEIAPGGCIMDTNYGSIDATLEERVKRVWQALEHKIPHGAQSENGENVKQDDEESAE